MKPHRSRIFVALIVAVVASVGAAHAASETALGLKVKLELLQKLGGDGLRVEVEADGSRIVLAGEVKKRATAELAEEVAKKVEGVRSVESRITVAGEGGGVEGALEEAGSELEDAALETKVRIALVDRLGSDGFRVGTDAASGVVTLEIPKSFSWSRKRQAVSITKKVAGVKKVVTLDAR